MPLVNGLRESGKFRAVAQEVGAHGKHNVNGQVRVVPGIQQQTHERSYFLIALSVGSARRFEPAVAKQLLELVDDNQEIGSVGEVSVLVDPGET